MLPKTHIIIGFIFSLILAIIFPNSIGLFGGLIIFLSSFLIDVDHYLYYVWIKKNWSLKKSLAWYNDASPKFNGLSQKQKAKIYTGLFFLHGIEALVILIALAFLPIPFFTLFIFVVMGFLIHQILDAIALYNEKFGLDKVISFIYSIKKAKGKKLIQDM